LPPDRPTDDASSWSSHGPPPGSGTRTCTRARRVLLPDPGARGTPGHPAPDPRVFLLCPIRSPARPAPFARPLVPHRPASRRHVGAAPPAL